MVQIQLLDIVAQTCIFRKVRYKFEISFGVSNQTQSKKDKKEGKKRGKPFYGLKIDGRR